MDILLNNILLEETYSITKDEIDNVIQNQRKSKIALRKNLLLAYHIVAASVVSIGILDVLSDLQGYRQMINNIPIYLSYMVLSLIYFAVCIYKITVLNPVMNTPTQTIKTIKQLSVMLWVEFSSIVIVSQNLVKSSAYISFSLVKTSSSSSILAPLTIYHCFCLG